MPEGANVYNSRFNIRPLVVVNGQRIETNQVFQGTESSSLNSLYSMAMDSSFGGGASAPYNPERPDEERGRL